MKQLKTKEIAEFGDFQTPQPLALSATKLLHSLSIKPRSIIEPTCGKGAFVAAASTCFPQAKKIIGMDINISHLNVAASISLANDAVHRIDLRQGDFFKTDWESLIRKENAPWLILGNPPWVTSSNLGSLNSDNLPRKSNFQGHSGIDAITGKSNFDISEWMLLRYLDWLEGTSGIIAVLCKTAVARKILLHIWKKRRPLKSARIYKIDAYSNFGAAVDACFFVLEVEPGEHTLTCDIFDSIESKEPSHSIGFLEGHIISDVKTFEKRHSLLGADKYYVWRSGIKHDCSKIMELSITETGYINGLKEQVELEETILYPMLKSSDIGNGRTLHRAKMLVTQRVIGEDTAYIQDAAPKTWRYLNRHSSLLNKRGSVIYKNKPSFSIFGVGAYSFAPWKVAISGFYKKLQFQRIGPVENRPVVFDDTIYFLPCWSEAEAIFVEEILNTDAAKEFFNSMIHWENKRPITVDILKRLSIKKLSAFLGREEEYQLFASQPMSQKPVFGTNKVQKVSLPPTTEDSLWSAFRQDSN